MEPYAREDRVVQESPGRAKTNEIFGTRNNNYNASSRTELVLRCRHI